MKKQILFVTVLCLSVLVLTSCSRIVSCNIYGQIKLHLVDAHVSDVDYVHVTLMSAPGAGSAYCETVYPKREDGYRYKFTSAKYGKNIISAKVVVNGKVYEPTETFKITSGETMEINLFLKPENYNPNASYYK